MEGIFAFVLLTIALFQAAENKCSGTCEGKGVRACSYCNPIKPNKNTLDKHVKVLSNKAWLINQVEIKQLPNFPFKDPKKAVDIKLFSNKMVSVAEAAFCGMSSLHTIHIEFNRLKCMPNVQPVSCTLKHMLLEHNQISTCSSDAQYTDVTEYPRLERLTLGFNGLTRLPSIVYHSKNLKSLNLISNKFKQIDDFVRLLKQITILFEGLRVYLTDNYYVCRPGFSINGWIGKIEKAALKGRNNACITKILRYALTCSKENLRKKTIGPTCDNPFDKTTGEYT